MLRVFRYASRVVRFWIFVINECELQNRTHTLRIDFRLKEFVGRSMHAKFETRAISN